MNKYLMTGAIALFVVLMAAVFLWRPLTMPFSGAVMKSSFVLQGAAGPVDSATLHGKVLAVVFAYARCPDACNPRIEKLVKAYQALGSRERGYVRLVLISADPERDTPAQIQAYADRFHPDILGLTGTPEQIKAVADGFTVTMEKGTTADGDYQLAISPLIHIVDAEGNFASILSENLPQEGIVRALQSRIPAQLPPGR